MSTGPDRRVGNIKILLFPTQPNNFLKYFLQGCISVAPVKFFRIFQTLNLYNLHLLVIHLGSFFNEGSLNLLRSFPRKAGLDKPYLKCLMVILPSRSNILRQILCAPPSCFTVLDGANSREDVCFGHVAGCHIDFSTVILTPLLHILNLENRILFACFSQSLSHNAVCFNLYKVESNCTLGHCPLV